MRFTPEKTVREIALAEPAAVRVFEKLGIDYCCGGNLALRIACARANVSPENVIGALEATGPADDADAPNYAGLSDLTRYIVNRHHEFFRRELPRIQALLVKVCARHGQVHSELREV